MAPEWPLAAVAADPPVDPARTRGSRRLASVRRDFLLDPAYRLTEQERALMTAMLHDLVGTIAAELFAKAPLHGRSRPDVVALTARLSNAGLLDREALVGLLLRRADEHRIAASFTSRSGPRELPLLPRLVGDPEAEVAAAAMALVVARGRRRDALGQPRVLLEDLDPADAESLAYAVAAALSDDREEQPATAEAAAAVLGGRSAGESLAEMTGALVAALHAPGRLDDKAVEGAATDGEASVLAGMLASRSGIADDTAWGYLVGGAEGGLALLARMAGLERPVAARLIAEFADLSGASVEEEIARFDRLAPGEVSAALAWWRLPAALRAPLTALAADHG